MKQKPIGRFEYFQDKREKWRWRYRVVGKIVADSGQGYKTFDGMAKAKEKLCTRIMAGERDLVRVKK